MIRYYQRLCHNIEATYQFALVMILKINGEELDSFSPMLLVSEPLLFET